MRLLKIIPLAGIIILLGQLSALWHYNYLWLLNGFLLLVLSMVIYQLIRDKVVMLELFKTGKTKCVAEYLNLNWGYLLAVYYLIIFAGLTGLVYIIFGIDYLLEGLIAAAFITTFIIFELPHLQKPIAYILCEKKIVGGTFTDSPSRDVILSKGENYILRFRIINLGVNNYQHCCFWFQFPKWIKPLVDECLYQVEDYQKAPLLQKGTNTIYFSPIKTYQTLHAGNSVYFPIAVEVQKEVDSTDKEMIIQFSCETRMGLFEDKLNVNPK